MYARDNRVGKTEVLVAVPSKGRAGAVRTQAVLPDCSVFVPVLGVEAYRQAGARNVVGVPNEVRGITATRNWILRNIRDRWVVMIDDDRTHGWVELLPHAPMKQTLTAAQWLASKIGACPSCYSPAPELLERQAHGAEQRPGRSFLSSDCRRQASSSLGFRPKPVGRSAQAKVSIRPFSVTQLRISEWLFLPHSRHSARLLPAPLAGGARCADRPNNAGSALAGRQGPLWRVGSD